MKALILIAILFTAVIPLAFAQTQSCEYGTHGAMYFDSGTDTELSEGWQRVYDAAVAHPCVDIKITANPNNGVGDVFESDTEFAIQTLKDVGVDTCAYVSTDWNNFGGKTEAEVKAEMDRWVLWYPDIACWFYDEMANDVGTGLNGDNVAYYTELTRYGCEELGVCHSRGNMGTDGDEAFKTSVDNIKVAEDEGLFDLSQLFNDWKANEPITLFTITTDSVSASVQEVEDWVNESQQYASHVYVQDDGNDGNAWDTLSVYFEQTVILQEAANLNGIPPPPISGTDVTGCGTLSQNGATYTQVNNIFAETNCITISGDGIKYNGNGFELIGNSGCSLGDESGDNAMTLTGDNITVENLTISFWRYGVVFEGNNNQLSDSSLSCITKYGGQFNGGTNSFFINNFCMNCQNGVHMAGGSNSDGNTIAGNIFRDSNHHQTHIHDGNQNNDLFDNNFFDITANEILDECNVGCNNVWHDNYYTTYDEESEGCFDSNNDDICDAPKIGEFNQDNSAHVTPRPLTSTPPDPPDPPTSETSVITVVTELDGIEFTGQWTVFSQNGVTLQTGFSPETFTVNNGEFYEVFVDNFQSTEFSEWENGTTGNPRIFSITTDTTFTATFIDTTTTPPDPPTEPPAEFLEVRVAQNEADIAILEENENALVVFFNGLIELISNYLAALQ